MQIVVNYQLCPGVCNYGTSYEYQHYFVWVVSFVKLYQSVDSEKTRMWHHTSLFSAASPPSKKRISLNTWTKIHSRLAFTFFACNFWINVVYNCLLEPFCFSVPCGANDELCQNHNGYSAVWWCEKWVVTTLPPKKTWFLNWKWLVVIHLKGRENVTTSPPPWQRGVDMARRKCCQ